MTAVDEIKARIDIIDLVSETVQLRRAGKNYTGFCPFHPNSRTPAFVVFPDSGTWRCFGQCNEGGDIFKFVMKKEGWDFSQTLRYLAERAGVQLEPLTPERQEEDEHSDRLRNLLEEAVTFFRYHLLQTAAGQTAQAFFQRRGLKPETIEIFGLGYGPESWDALTNHFTGKGYTQADLIAAGLVSERQSGGVYDRFRNRAMFPIRDERGRMAGFGARILNPEDQPKFLNSPQTDLFDKGHLLYALDQARKPIRAQDQVVIVEGYLDVVVLHQAGFTNVVSPMGTALTEDQIRILKRFSRRIVLALDADAAGQKATLRGLEIARQAMDHSQELGFDARGLLRHEARLEADLRVTTIPEGMDPDEVVLRDPAEWQRILDAAQPVVIHVMESLASGRDLDDPKVKSEIAEQVLPLIEDVPGAVERDAYRQRLARLLRVDERSLLAASAQTNPRPSGRRKPAALRDEAARERRERPAARVSSTRAGAMHEGYALRLLLRHPEALYPLDRVLQKYGLARFTPVDFEQTDHQSLAQLIARALEQEELEASQYLHEHIPEDLRDLANALLAPIEGGDPSAEELPEDLARSVLNLRLARTTENVSQLRFLQEDIQDPNDLRLNTYNQMMAQYYSLRSRLDRALRDPLLME